MERSISSVKLKCKKCEATIEIPVEMNSSPGMRLICPGCGAKYRLKARRGPGRPAAPTSAEVKTSEVPTEIGARGSTSSSMHTTPLTHPGTSSTVHLSAGEILADRYAIVQFLAQGGMGEVYEAEDRELRQRVALKTIKSDGITADSLIERFKREIFLARKVTHPNVCRIFDLGQHRFADQPARPPIDFLTMELLHGETLAACLKRRHHLETVEAHPLARQMVLALNAAHRAQVIHRDFKSENVFLVPEAEGTRVVVTDFGVARGGTQDDRFAAGVTGIGVVGTPAYMAPEQVESNPISPATDIYALGIVLYEMVTGRLPFEGENPLTTAVKRLREAPEPPRVHVPDLDLKWQQTILRCLEREPEKRFASANDVLASLEGETSVAVETVQIAKPPAPTADTKRERTKRRLVLELVLLFVVTVSAALLLWNREPDVDRTKLVPRRSVAVYGLQNLASNEESAWLSRAISEMLTTELARGQALRTIPRTNVSEARMQLEQTSTAEFDAATLGKIRDLLGCDFLVSGSFLTLGSVGQEQIRLDLHLHDASLGTQLGSWSEDGQQADLFAMVGILGSELREQLGVSDSGLSDDPMAGLPSDATAARLYAEALDLLEEAKPEEARGRLQEALAIERQNPLLHAALSAAWEAEGYVVNAANEAELAYQLSEDLPREDRLDIEARYREARGDRAGAIQSYRALWDFFPDNLEYGLRLLAVEIEDGRISEGMKTLAELRALPALLSDDPRIELSAASLASIQADFDGQLEAAEQAAADANRLGNQFLVAEARLSAAQALQFLGRSEAAEASGHEALEIYRQLGRSAGAALASTTVANALYSRSNFEAAAEQYERAVEQYRSVGDRGGAASALNNLALARKRLGELDLAHALYEEAAVIYREVDDSRGLANSNNNLAAVLIARGRLQQAEQLLDDATGAWQELNDKIGVAFGLNNMAVVLRYQAKLEESRAMHEQALALRREIGHRIGESSSLTNLALVLLDSGQVVEAESLLESALEVNQEIDNPSGRALALTAVGESRRLRGDFEGARRAHQEALELRRELDQSLEITESRHFLVKLALDEGLFEQAEVASQQVIGAYERENRPSYQADALSTRAFALLGQQRSHEASELLDSASAFAAESEEPAVKLRIAIAKAAALGQGGETEQARVELETLRAQAAALGLVELEFRCVLALLDLFRSTRDLPTAERMLDWVRVESTVRGLELFSNLAGDRS